MTQNNFGALVRKRRIEMNLTQVRLAQLTLCYHTNISRIEAGLDVPPRDLELRIRTVLELHDEKGGEE